MSRFMTKVASLICVALFCGGFGFAMRAAQCLACNRTMPKTHLSGLGLPGLLADLAAKYRVAIGVEEARSGASETERRTSMDLPEGTLSSLLDRVIGTDKRYNWNEVDGVIQVFPKNQREELLDVLIGEFSVEGVLSSASVEDAICNLPEVKSKMTSLGIAAFNPIELSLGKEIRHSFSIHVHNVTLRDLLNGIAKNSEKHFWSIVRWGPNHEIMRLEF